MQRKMNQAEGALRDKERELGQKEEDLTRMMKLYYTYDMTQLEEEVTNLMSSRISKLSADKEKKLKKITDDFTKISGLA